MESETIPGTLTIEPRASQEKIKKQEFYTCTKNEQRTINEIRNTQSKEQ